jgi:UDP-N-acetylmuramoyl-tripeptide--D-alanyl-D-alanine ligase
MCASGFIMKLELARVALLMQASGQFDAGTVATGYSIDSRTVQPGELFFAVRGERLEGHDFVEAALSRGAVAAVVRSGQVARYANGLPLMAVDDTLTALQRLAAAVRKLWGKPLIGVTGSAGKTTTKEIIGHVLATRYRVLKSQGNLNNHFGLPLQLLKLEPDHEIAVIEMGMSHPGEITALAKIAQPDCGVVTIVAPVHLEFFDSLAGIARAKYELIQSLPPGGIAVLNADDPHVSQFGRDFHGKVATFGLHVPSDVTARNIEWRQPVGSTFDIVSEGETARAELPLLGEHSIYNALAATTVGLQYGVSLPAAARSLESAAAGEKRGQVVEHAGATIINDCYNSNPTALDSMVRSLAGMPAKRHIVVAGEMLELGPDSEAMHRDCGRHMGRLGVDFLIGVRGMARFIVEGAAAENVVAEFLASPEDAGEWLKRHVRAGDVVLLKASRGVRLERALDVLMGKASEIAH